MNKYDISDKITKLDFDTFWILDHVFEVIGNAADTHLGRNDFDTVMVDYFVEEFMKDNEGYDPRECLQEMERLRDECEKAKWVLSIDTTADIEISQLYDGMDFCSSIANPI